MTSHIGPDMGRPAEQGNRGSNIAIFVTLMLVINVVSIVMFEGSRIGDFLTLGSGLLIIAIVIWRVRITARMQYVLLPFLGLILLYGLQSLHGGLFDGIKNMVSVSLCAAIFAFSAVYARAMLRSKAFVFVAVTAALIIVVYSFFTDAFDNNAINAVAVYSVFLAGFALAYQTTPRRGALVLVFTLLLVIVISIINDHRALAGLTFGATIFYILMQSGHLRKVAGWPAFLIVTALIVMIFVYFTFLAHDPDWGFINDLTTEVSGRRALSGRDKIWPLVFLRIAQNPFFGHGAGSVPSQFFSFSYSSHNFYIQVAFQVGVFGIAFVALVFWRLWRQLARSFRHNRFAPIGLAVLAMALLHNSFVVMFFQNLVVAAIPFWVFMGLCVGLSLDDKTHHQPAT